MKVETTAWVASAENPPPPLCVSGNSLEDILLRMSKELARIPDHTYFNVTTYLDSDGTYVGVVH